MDEQCEALVPIDVVPWGKRCPNKATVTTEDGAHYCDEHKDWDEE